MTEFIFELLFEIIIEGSFELGTSKKVPWPLRLIALTILLVIYGGLFTIFVLIARDCFLRGDLGAFFIVLIITLILVILFGFAIYKTYKRKVR